MDSPALSWRLVQGCTLPSPRDSWDWLNQKPCDPIKRDKAVTDNGWMDGLWTLWTLDYKNSNLKT